jgi:hypothetical protein
MNIYRVLLVVLIAIVYTALFWVLPFSTDGGIVVAAILHGIVVLSMCLVFSFVWLLERW